MNDSVLKLDQCFPNGPSTISIPERIYKPIFLYWDNKHQYQ